jgi:starvation-inducible DNA-binding protein
MMAMTNSVDAAEPRLATEAREIQPFGSLTHVPLGLGEEVRAASVKALNQVLADTITLRDLYKKHHWQVSGATFYALHLLLDKHYGEQADLVDAVAERIQTLGGISLAMAADVAEETRIARPPRGREDVPTQLSRLLEAHQLILAFCREAAAAAAKAGDDGTNDLLVSQIVRTGELQAWFLAEHLAATPLLVSGRREP